MCSKRMREEHVPGFEARLAAEPHRFAFLEALRRLEALHPDRARLGRSTRPAQDPLRLAQEPAVTFAPASLAGWEQGSGPPRLLVHFFGLFGPDGPLPLHLTEYARDRQRNNRDPTFARFADIFHHRAMSLFYRAWADSQPTVSFDRPEDDRFAGHLAALIGQAGAAMRDRDAMPDLTRLHFAGHLAGQTRHAEGLAAILSEFFAMPVRVACFIGTWLGLPAADNTRLGERRETATLGVTAVLGNRVWSRVQKFRLVFGPLTLPEYERLLPGGPSFHSLIPIVRYYAGDVLLWDLNLVLRQDEVPRTSLGRSGRLGWTTWLTPRPQPHDADDLLLDAGADSLAQRMDARAHPATERRA